MKATLSFLSVFSIFLLFSTNIEAQTSATVEADSIKLPVWKQIRQQYGLPITRQKRGDFERTGQHFWQQDRKKHLALLLSLPYANCYNLAPEGTGKRDKSFGFMGIALGLEYYYGQNTSLLLKWNATMAFLAPVPAPVDYESNHTHCQGMDLNLMQNHYIKFLSIGYGICVTRNSWNYHTEGYDVTEPSDCNFGNIDLSYQKYAIGTPLHIYGSFSKLFGIGLNYRPTFYRINSPKPWKYEHLISIDFQFRILL
ncbi:hypothetical protein [Bacteroides sp.]